MGRPLNKRFIGTPTAGGNELKVQFHNGTASVPGYIVKQTGSKRFVCKDGAGVEATCYLTNAAAAALVAGEMSISVKDDAGTIFQVIKIAAKKLTLEDGSTTGWNFSTSNTDEAVEVEEAGDDAVLTNATNLEGDIEI